VILVFGVNTSYKGPYQHGTEFTTLIAVQFKSRHPELVIIDFSESLGCLKSGPDTDMLLRYLAFDTICYGTLADMVA